MKQIISILLFSVAFGAFCQSEDTIKFSKIDLGYTFSPDYCYRYLRSENADQWIKEGYDSLEISKFGYTLGINGVFNLKSNLTFSSGVLFSNKGERTRKELIPQLNNYINHYYYLEVPLSINYYLLNNKIKLYLTGGLSASIFLNHSIVSDLVGNSESYRVTNNANISRFNLGAKAGIGFDCPLTNKWYFKMEALYKQSVSSIGDTPVKKYLYSISPNLGFYFHF